jgi:hypothetical protein
MSPGDNVLVRSLAFAAGGVLIALGLRLGLERR